MHAHSTCHAERDRCERTMRCVFCRLSWDLDDPDPPLCPAAELESVTDERATNFTVTATP